MKKLTIIFMGFTFSFIFILTLFFCVFVPLHSSRTIWKGYQIVGVSLDTDINKLIEKLEHSGFSNTISCLSIKNKLRNIDASVPISYNHKSQESYNKWFFGPDSMQYLYLPIKKYLQIRLRQIIRSSTNDFFIEDVKQIYKVNLIFLLIFSAICFWSTEKRVVFMISSLPFLIYGSFSKGILVFLSSVLTIYSITYWLAAFDSNVNINLEQLKRRILENPILIIAPVFVLVINFILEIKFLFLLTVASSFSAVLFLHFAYKLHISKKQQNMNHSRIKLYAISQTSIERFWSTSKLMIVSIASIIIIVVGSCILSLFFKNYKFSHNIKTLSLPTPEISTEQGFTEQAYTKFLAIRKSSPMLTDLVTVLNYAWDSKKLLYMPLHKNRKIVKVGDTINYNEFKVYSDGTVHEQENKLFQFNSKYINMVLNNVESNSINKLLYTQNRFIQARHKNVMKKNNYVIEWALILLASILPLVVILKRILK